MTEVRHDDSKVFFPESVVAECVFVMNRLYKIPREEIADKLGGIMRFRGTTGDNAAMFIHALQIYGASSQFRIVAEACILAHDQGGELRFSSLETPSLKCPRQAAG